MRAFARRGTHLNEQFKTALIPETDLYKANGGIKVGRK